MMMMMMMTTKVIKLSHEKGQLRSWASLNMSHRGRHLKLPTEKKEQTKSNLEELGQRAKITEKLIQPYRNNTHTKGQNQVILRHQNFTFAQAREWAKWASEWTSEHSGGRERSEQSGASERVSGASEWANGRGSGPVLTSGFLVVLAHSDPALGRV